MTIEKTNYGIRVIIPATDNNSEFVYKLRQVRILNDNNPEEQPLLKAIERREKPLIRRFLTVAQEMENLFGKLRTREDWEKWEKRHGDFNRLYHDRLRALEEQIQGCSYDFAENSRHGYCI